MGSRKSRITLDIVITAHKMIFNGFEMMSSASDGDEHADFHLIAHVGPEKFQCCLQPYIIQPTMSHMQHLEDLDRSFRRRDCFGETDSLFNGLELLLLQTWLNVFVRIVI